MDQLIGQPRGAVRAVPASSMASLQASGSIVAGRPPLSCGSARPLRHRPAAAAPASAAAYAAAPNRSDAVPCSFRSSRHGCCGECFRPSHWLPGRRMSLGVAGHVEVPAARPASWRPTAAALRAPLGSAEALQQWKGRRHLRRRELTVGTAMACSLGGNPLESRPRHGRRHGAGVPGELVPQGHGRVATCAAQVIPAATAQDDATPAGAGWQQIEPPWWAERGMAVLVALCARAHATCQSIGAALRCFAVAFPMWRLRTILAALAALLTPPLLIGVKAAVASTAAVPTAVPGSSGVGAAAAAAAAAAAVAATPMNLAELWTACMILVGLLTTSALCSMSETSITTLWPWKVRELAEREGDDSPFAMLRTDVTRFLSTILIISTLANVGATAIATEYATRIWGEAGVGASAAIMTIVTVLFTEITPKSVAVHNAIPVARALLQPIAALSYIFYPVGRACTLVCSWVLSLLGVKGGAEPFVTEDELKLIISGAESSGAIEEEEQDMIENVLDLEERTVKEIMTPLVDVVAVEGSAKLSDLLRLWQEHQYSRVPVYDGRIDNIVGVAYTMEMLEYLGNADMLDKMEVSKAMAHKPGFFVPETMTVQYLLREFRIRKVHMAIVVNEYGGTAGIVTLEDVVEEIVGEIYDETDTKEEIARRAAAITQIDEGLYEVDAQTPREDVEEALLVKFPEGEYETMSGYIFQAFGHIPQIGETVVVTLPKVLPDKFDGALDKEKAFVQYRLTITAGTVRKVRSVQLELVGECEESAECTDPDYDRSDEDEGPSVRRSRDRKGNGGSERRRQRDSAADERTNSVEEGGAASSTASAGLSEQEKREA